MTRPAPLPSLCFAHRRFGDRTSVRLSTWWLALGRVGLFTHWVTMTIFKGVTLFHHPGFTLGTTSGLFGRRPVQPKSWWRPAQSVSPWHRKGLETTEVFRRLWRRQGSDPSDLLRNSALGFRISSHPAGAARYCHRWHSAVFPGLSLATAVTETV
jgi:hypothetical protein